MTLPTGDQGNPPNTWFIGPIWVHIANGTSIGSAHKHTHTHLYNGPLSRTTWVSRYQKGKTNLDFTEARDSEWQWHQLSHKQVCISLQTDNHASTPPLSFLKAGCPSCHPTNSVKELKAGWPVFYRLSGFCRAQSSNNKQVAKVTRQKTTSPQHKIVQLYSPAGGANKIINRRNGSKKYSLLNIATGKLGGPTRTDQSSNYQSWTEKN